MAREGAFRECEMSSFAFEKHYRIRELAGLWGLSARTVTTIFADEAGVFGVANDGTYKRNYAGVRDKRAWSEVPW
jgi:hypothetical protein